MPSIKQTTAIISRRRGGFAIPASDCERVFVLAVVFELLLEPEAVEGFLFLFVCAISFIMAQRATSSS
jgi:hypothetical protein